ncbi:hypothetical protein G9A89_005616 [Geosiphon pyriformis]|nr:hypothetical protein G9A89_005616 [Geosiphon pyriformis]
MPDIGKLLDPQKAQVDHKIFFKAVKKKPPLDLTIMYSITIREPKISHYPVEPVSINVAKKLDKMSTYFDAKQARSQMMPAYQIISFVHIL